MNVSLSEIPGDLRRIHRLYTEVLGLVEHENQSLRHAQGAALFASFAARKRYLPELDSSLDQLRRHRNTWTRLPPEERSRHPEIIGLLRQCQDLIMKILLLDRENEQHLLRHGLLGPRNLPPHQSQRPGFVADLYRRQAAG